MRYYPKFHEGAWRVFIALNGKECVACNSDEEMLSYESEKMAHYMAISLETCYAIPKEV